MTQFNVTDTDFDTIKASLIAYLRSQSKYNDYDFEGSGLSVLLDILAYNTHYNALLAHMLTNESFIDSAQLRPNVTSRAKLLGYVPRSTIGSTAIVDLSVEYDTELTVPVTLTLPRGTKFTTTVDSIQYPFVVEETVTAARLPDDTFTFESVSLKQGNLKTIRRRVDNNISNQKFIIPDTDVDTSTLVVRVRENENATSYTTYTKYSTISTLSSTSTVYFIQENASGQYEIYFGDGSIGINPTSNSIVELEYVYSVGEETNGAKVFTFADTISGIVSVDVTVVDPAYGGSERESIDSIRFNAPITFVSQNRAVTADDYKAVLQQLSDNIDDISVWGGEDQIEPEYGRVYICIKPQSGNALSDAEKDSLETEIIKKNVLGVTPIIVDPDYTYLKLTAYFKYNPNITDKSRVELQNLVRSVIESYGDNELSQFDGVFRYSKLLRQIDLSEPSILNSYVHVQMFKDFIPVTAIANDVELTFSSQIYQSSNTASVISSSSFLISGVKHYFGDAPIEGSDIRQVYVYKIVDNEQITVIGNAGTVNPAEGTIRLQNFTPDTTDSIRINAVPNSFDLAPKRNQLLAIDSSEMSVTGEIDTIAVGGANGIIDYTTTPRS